MNLLLIRDGLRILLPNLVIYDERGRDATDAWFQNIGGLQVLDESHLTRPSFIPGSPYLSVHERIARAREAGLGDGISVIREANMIFAQTPYEQMINVTVPLALRRTAGPVVAPPLTNIGYLDGRPPVRIYLWEDR